MLGIRLVKLLRRPRVWHLRFGAVSSKVPHLLTTKAFKIVFHLAFSLAFDFSVQVGLCFKARWLSELLRLWLESPDWTVRI